jgi:hypothetical protein
MFNIRMAIGRLLLWFTDPVEQERNAELEEIHQFYEDLNRNLFKKAPAVRQQPESRRLVAEGAATPCPLQDCSNAAYP